MKRTLGVAVLAIAVLAAVGGCSALTGSSQTRTISVTGTATAHLTPDIVLVTLGVQTQGADVAQAVNENNARSGRVIQALKDGGVAPADIQTANFSISSQSKVDSSGNPTGETVYYVSNMVSLTVRDLPKLGDLLQSALTQGANSVQGVIYSIADPAAALDQARVEALNDARQQAEQLASSAGVSLGPVFSMSDSYSPPPITYAAPSFGKGGGGGGSVPTSPGVLDYQVQLYVVYSLK
jgi:uncharacterized protein YggE